MKKIDIAIVMLVLIGLVGAGFGGWYYRQEEVDFHSKMAVERGEALVEMAERFTKTKIELLNTQANLEAVEEKLGDTKANLEAVEERLGDTKNELHSAEVKIAGLEDALKLPWITGERIFEEFGIKVSGKVYDDEYIGSPMRMLEDRYLTPDELLLIYNVLFSLPAETVKKVRSITVVADGVGSGGRYEGLGNVVIYGFPDEMGSRWTARVGFVRALYHEIGHAVDFKQPHNEREKFRLLHEESNKAEAFAEFYGSNSELEDFATIFASYALDSVALKERAQKNPALGAKMDMVVKFFGDYTYKVELVGDITRWDGQGNEMVWRYKSRNNPGIEMRLGW